MRTENWMPLRCKRIYCVIVYSMLRNIFWTAKIFQQPKFLERCTLYLIPLGGADILDFS